MKLWTHHPSDFQLDTAAEIDHTRGQYWNLNMRDFRYREVLLRLHQHIGTDQFLWCCTVRGGFMRTTEEIDWVEWELDIPESEVLKFYRVPIWEDIVWSRSDDWDQLFVDKAEADIPNQNVGALVKFPVRREWVKCHGPLPVRYPRTGRASKPRRQ